MPCIAFVHVTADCCLCTHSSPSCTQVATQTKPDLIIFVMDGSIGQAAHDQAKAFRDTVEVCAVSLTPHPVTFDDSTCCMVGCAGDMSPADHPWLEPARLPAILR